MSIEDLILFKAASTNEKDNTHLRYISAKLFIPQLNELLSFIPFQANIKSIKDYANDTSESLKHIFNKHGSDKGKHNYYHIYSYIFKCLGVTSNINLLEIGLGTNNPNIISNMTVNGKPGASLKAFSEFLPNSMIYGADIDEAILFQTERINTTYVDQLDYATFKNIDDFKVDQFDLIIDDGLHSIGANLNTLIYALKHISPNGHIIIEDINEELINNWQIIAFIISNMNLVFEILKAKRCYIFYIHH